MNDNFRPDGMSLGFSYWFVGHWSSNHLFVAKRSPELKEKKIMNLRMNQMLLKALDSNVRILKLSRWHIIPRMNYNLRERMEKINKLVKTNCGQRRLDKHEIKCCRDVLHEGFRSPRTRLLSIPRGPLSRPIPSQVAKKVMRASKRRLASLDIHEMPAFLSQTFTTNIRTPLLLWANSTQMC